MVEGDLEDLPLASLLAVLARDRTTGSVRVQRGLEQGALYLQDGDVVHALAGRASGDRAVGLLLGKTGGRFRLVREAVTQPRTVTRPLAEFLGGGDDAAAIATGSSPTHAAAAASGSREDSAADGALFAQLLELLTRLEQDRARLAEGRVDPSADAGLLVVVHIVNTLIAFVLARRRDAAAQPVQVLARMAATQPYAQLFGADNGHITIDAVVAALEGESDANGERQRALAAVGDALVDVLGEYCGIAATLFHASAERDQWRTTSEVFLEDLRAAVQQLDVEQKGDAHGQEMRARRR